MNVPEDGASDAGREPSESPSRVKSQSWTRSNRRSFDIAARSLLESEISGGNAGFATVLTEGVLYHHWGGLGQYATIRVGTVAAAHALDALRGWSEQHLSALASSDGPVRPSALLYRQLRTLIVDLPARRLSVDAAEWFCPSDERLAGAVVRLRGGLTDRGAEVLELCHHRGLEPVEAAAVLDRPQIEIERSLAAALAVADGLLSARDKRDGMTRERVLLAAFSLNAGRLEAPPVPRRRPVFEVGDVVGQRYEIEALLGAGSFADVYRARDRDVTGHVVALKVLRRPAVDDQAVKSALRELQLIASVVHPSVVQLKDHGWREGHLWFVMPFYRGETLAKRLARGPLSRREARDIFELLAEALGTMHRVGVRHQDIKPDNVFLASLGAEEHGPPRLLPVLLDLGVAAKDVELVLAGTPAYFAPEVAARYSGIPDPPAVGPPADVFALALTLRDALEPTPSDPTAAGAVDAFVSFRARHAPPPPKAPHLRDLHASFERWLHRMPDARPDAETFRRELAILTRPEERRKRRTSLLRWLLPTTLATLTLFISVVYVLTQEAAVRRREAEEERVRASQAFRRIETMHASLEVQASVRQKLEAEVAKLETDYQNSRLTREELAARLTSTEGEARAFEERQSRQLANLRRQKDDLEGRLRREQALLSDIEALRDRRDELARELDRTKLAFEQERTLRVEAQATSSSLAARLDALQRAIEQARLHMAELNRSMQTSGLGSRAADTPASGGAAAGGLQTRPTPRAVPAAGSP